MKQITIIKDCHISTVNIYYYQGARPDQLIRKGEAMGDIANRFKVKGMVKFQVDDFWVADFENIDEALQNSQNIVVMIEGAAENGNLEITISEVEDLGPCDVDEYYEQKETSATSPGSEAAEA